MNEKTLALVGLGAVGLFVVSRVVQANSAGFPHGVASPVPASSPSMLDTLINNAKKGIAVEGIVAGSLAKLGILGGAAAAPVAAAILPVIPATIGIDAATVAALPGAIAVESAPLAGATTESLAAAASSEATGGGIGAAGLSSFLLPLAIIPAFLFGGSALIAKIVGGTGQEYAPGCAPGEPGYPCLGGSADSGASIYGGNVGYQTAEEAAAGGFGDGQY